MSSLTEKDLRELDKEIAWHCCGAIEIEASIDGEEASCQLFVRRGSTVSEEIIPEPLGERRSGQFGENFLADYMEDYLLRGFTPRYRGDNWG